MQPSRIRILFVPTTYSCYECGASPSFLSVLMRISVVFCERCLERKVAAVRRFLRNSVDFEAVSQREFTHNLACNVFKSPLLEANMEDKRLTLTLPDFQVVLTETDTQAFCQFLGKAAY